MKDEMDISEMIIKSRAYVWIGRFPASTLMEYEDLVQEGWISYCICKNGDLFDPEKGKSFPTFLYYAVNYRFKNLLTKEFRRKRLGANVPIDIGDSSINLESPPDQEQRAMLSEALTAMAEVSADFVKMITEGAPKELIGSARRKIRSKAVARGQDPMNCNVKIEKTMIEEFFGVELRVLKLLYYSYI